MKFNLHLLKIRLMFSYMNYCLKCMISSNQNLSITELLQQDIQRSQQMQGLFSHAVLAVA